MRPKLRSLEKNILKYRALQMVLLLHQVESLRTFVIDSIRATEGLHAHQGGSVHLPIGTKRPMQRALSILVHQGILTDEESVDLQSIIELRNKIGHRVHDVVADISAPEDLRSSDFLYDHFALERFEQYREKIATGMAGHFVLSLDFRDISFEQAEATYKEELGRLRERINKQYDARQGAAARVERMLRRSPLAEHS